ncbi:T9SS type A sorting domain-containing protein [Roseivirga sp. BDSF3-8]|uniref:T9SS type A sorting domain-containing protein n=1 Tax=Roseivirga sp. BDSF3-8 TaxID=3241598 RepID=UPI0035324467
MNLSIKHSLVIILLLQALAINSYGQLIANGGFEQVGPSTNQDWAFDAFGEGIVTGWQPGCLNKTVGVVGRGNLLNRNYTINPAYAFPGGWYAGPNLNPPFSEAGNNVALLYINVGNVDNDTCIAKGFTGIRSQFTQPLSIFQRYKISIDVAYPALTGAPDQIGIDPSTRIILRLLNSETDPGTSVCDYDCQSTTGDFFGDGKLDIELTLNPSSLPPGTANFATYSAEFSIAELMQADLGMGTTAPLTVTNGAHMHDIDFYTNWQWAYDPVYSPDYHGITPTSFLGLVDFKRDFEVVAEFPQFVQGNLTSSKAGVIIDNITLTEVCDLQADFSTTFSCAEDGQSGTLTVSLNSTYNGAYSNNHGLTSSFYILVGANNAQDINDPNNSANIIQLYGPSTSFTIPYQPGQGIAIKHGMWVNTSNSCGWTEDLKLINVPSDFNQSTPSASFSYNQNPTPGGLAISATAIYPASKHWWTFRDITVSPYQTLVAETPPVAGASFSYGTLSERHTYQLTHSNAMHCGNQVNMYRFTFEVKVGSSGQQIIEVIKEENITEPALEEKNGRSALTDDKVESISDASAFYPNPVRDFLNIETGNMRGKATFKVYSTSGNILMDEELSLDAAKSQVDMTSLPSGTYYLIVTDNTGVKQKHLFIKQ